MRLHCPQPDKLPLKCLTLCIGSRISCCASRTFACRVALNDRTHIGYVLLRRGMGWLQFYVERTIRSSMLAPSCFCLSAVLFVRQHGGSGHLPPHLPFYKNVHPLKKECRAFNHEQPRHSKGLLRLHNGTCV